MPQLKQCFLDEIKYQELYTLFWTTGILNLTQSMLLHMKSQKIWLHLVSDTQDWFYLLRSFLSIAPSARSIDWSTHLQRF